MDEATAPRDEAIDALRAEVEALRDAIAACRHQLGWLVEAVDMLNGRLGPSDRAARIPIETAPASPVGFPILPREWPVHFGHIAPSEHFLATGWWPREPWGVWSKGVSQLCFSLPADYDAAHVALVLTLQNFTPPGSEEAPSIDIVANGYFLGSHVLRRTVQKLRLRLPPSCTASADILLEISYANPISAVDAGMGVDERTLGVGLIAMELL